jgi:rhodanese-related sulfurtransferase
MFRSTSHDFGTVAKAAKTEHRFLFENPYNQPIHVRSVRTSCGCTTPIIQTEMVPPGGQGSILARFNTVTHSGARAATVTVSFDKPSFGEVQLQVKGYIRTDVVFQPGEVSFGSIPQGESKSLEILVDYAGKPTWQITGVRCDESCIQIEKEENSRPAGGKMPELNTGLTTGNEITDVRFKKVFEEGITDVLINADEVFQDPSKYFVINYERKDKYDDAHIPGSVRYKPNATLGFIEEMGTIPADKTVVVYCGTGHNSAFATAYLRLLGYDARTLRYGNNSFMYDWMKKDAAGLSWLPFTEAEVNNFEVENN